MTRLTASQITDDQLSALYDLLEARYPVNSTAKFLVTFDIDSTRSKQRPRLGRGGNVYTPKKTLEAEMAVGWQFKQANRGHRVDADSAFGVALTFHGAREGQDVDNMTKLVLDGLNGVCWKDDRQVVEIHARKVPADSPRTEVSIFIVEGAALMARSEARLRTRIWDDEDFLILPGHQQLAYLFLISQPDISHCGVLSLRLRRWAKKLKYTPEQLDKALAGLEAARFVVVDHDEEELLVRSFLRNDGVCKNFKVLKSAAAHLPQIASEHVRDVLAAEIRRALDEGLGTDSTRSTLVAMLSSLGGPSDGVPDGSSDGPSVGHRMGHAMGQPDSDGAWGWGRGKGSRSVVTKARSPKADPPSEDPDFALWYLAYPRKVKRAKARSAWMKAAKKAGATKLIDAITEHAARWKATGTETEFIPHPSTWLNQEYWDSDAMDLIPDKARGDARASPKSNAPELIPDAEKCEHGKRATTCGNCRSERIGRNP